MNVKEALIKGLQSTPKYIPVWYRYDKQGSEYNDRCLEENKYYYFYSSEISVIKLHVQVSHFFTLPTLTSQRVHFHYRSMKIESIW